MERQYKDSGIQWIGFIPKNWRVLRNKNAFVLGKDIIGNKSSETQLLSLTTMGIKAIKQGDTSGKVPESYDTYQIVKTNNLVLCLFDLDCSAVFAGISSYYGMISPAYKVLTCKTIMNPQYANYWFSYVFVGRKFKNYSKNIRYSLTYEEFSALNVLVPPINDQQRIASYLDKKCGEIDELIALQEKMIAQLTEYKQAVITEAVTKGLDPNAKLVPSGIEWIGDMPEGWKVCKMKYLCNYIKDGTHFSPNTVAEGYPYITATDVRGVGIDYNNAKKVTKEVFIELQKAGCQPHKGDILLVKDGATTGRVGMMADDTECVLLSSVAMLSTNNKTTNKYLMYILMSDLLQSQMKLSMAGAALPRITLIKLTNFISLYAPLPEQHSIASYLDAKCSEIDTLIALKRQKIESLNAYKKSIIYEAVTGKTII